jgi:hypothetical protein
VAKAKKMKSRRKPYTAADIKLLRQHSKARTQVSKISKLMKRTEGSLRQPEHQPCYRFASLRRQNLNIRRQQSHTRRPEEIELLLNDKAPEVGTERAPAAHPSAASGGSPNKSSTRPGPRLARLETALAGRAALVFSR